jgi:excisionase family DNA binding protein
LQKKQKKSFAMEQVLTFDKLPEAVTMLTKEVIELKRLLIEKQGQPPTEQADQLLTIQEAAEFLKLTVPTMYSKVSKGELPVMKRSKRLYFSRTELLDYLKAGRKKTTSEIAAEAEQYVNGKKKRG